MGRLASLLLLLVAANAAAGGYEIAPPAVGPTRASYQQPLVAASRDTVLTVFPVSSIGTSALVGSLADSSGRVLTPVAFPIAAAPSSSIVDLTALDDGYAVLTDDYHSAELTVLDQKGRVQSRRRLGFRTGTLHKLASDGDHFLFIDSAARGWITDLEGNVVGSPITLPSQFSSTSRVLHVRGWFFAVYASTQSVGVATISKSGEKRVTVIDRVAASRVVVNRDGDGLIVLWFNHYDLLMHIARVSPDGAVVDVAVPRGASPVGISARPDGARIFHADRAGLWTLDVERSGKARGNDRLLIASVVGSSGAMAETSTGGYYIASRTLDEQIVGTFLDPSLQPSARVLLSTLPLAQHAAAIASDGTGFVAIFAEDASLRSVPLLFNGAPRADATVVDSERAWGPVIASSGSDYLVVWRSATTVRAARLDLDGRMIDPRPLVLEERATDRIAVAWTGQSYLVVLGRHEEFVTTAKLTSIVLPRGGWPNPPRTFDVVLPPTQPGVASQSGGHPSMAWNGREALLVWPVAQYPPFSMPVVPPTAFRTVALRLDERGLPLDSSAALLDQKSAGSYEADARQTSVASNGRDFLVLMRNRDEMQVLPVSTDGSLRAGTARTLPSPPIGLLSTALAATPDGYVAGFTYSLAVANLLVLRTLDRTGLSTGPAMSARTGRLTSLAPLSLASNLFDETVALVVENRDASPRAVAYGSATLAPVPRPPDAPVAVRIVDLPWNAIRIEWTDVSADEDAFVVESMYNGSWKPLAYAAQDAESVTVTSYWASTTAIRVRALNAAGTSTSDPVPFFLKRRSVVR